MHSEKAYTEMVSDFLPYIHWRAARLKKNGAETEDVVQEGLLALVCADRTYNPNLGSSFKTYALRCINNRLNTIGKKANNSHRISAVDYSLFSGEIEDTSITSSPEQFAVIREEYDRLINHIDSVLSARERKILALYLLGYSYLAMAELLKTTPKSVDNALQRARRKLKSDKSESS